MSLYCIKKKCYAEKGLKQLGDIQSTALPTSLLYFGVQLDNIAQSHLQLVHNHCFKASHPITATVMWC